MDAALELRILTYLTDRLSAGVRELVEASGQDEAVVKPALKEMEREQLIHRVTDSVRGEDLFSPTARGILKVRHSMKSAY